MKKILLLIEHWNEVGGVQRYLRGVTEELVREGGEIVIVSPKTKRFFWPLTKPAWLPLFIFLWRKAKRQEFEVLFCGKALFEGLAGYYLKKHLGVPYVVFTYAMEIESWRSQKGELRKLERVLRNADLVVYINEVTKNTLKELGVEEERLVKVYPGITLTPHPSPLSRRGERRYIFSVGRLIARKGFDTLIEAFAQIDQVQFGDVELWIVGEGPERQKLEQIAEENWVNKSVKFLGEVSDEALQELYVGAEIFALTPRDIEGDFEGFGIVYLEAAAHGVPAVGTRSGGVPEAVVHDETGLLAPPDDSKAVAIALMQLLANADLRDRLGKRARLRVREEFTWKKTMAEFSAALREL